MRTDITSEHAEDSIKILNKSRVEFALEFGFEHPPSGNNGWIEPDGTLRANHYEDHSIFCDWWYGLPEEEIEKTHVKLSDGCAYFEGKRLTSRQAKTLLDYGYDPEKVADGKRTPRKRYD